MTNCLGVPPRLWWRRRGAGVILALAVELLLLLALLTLAPRPVPRFKGQAEKTFELANVDADNAPATKSRSRVQPHAKAAPNPADRAKPAPARAESQPPAPEPLGEIPGLLHLSREDYAASDIGKIKRAPAAAPAELADAGGPDGSGDSAPIGNAPNGEPLYAAEWFRRPRDAELSPYLAKARAAPGGWGLIACQTAPRYRVENCQILGESPAGSSLGYQVREAAWQFQVLPPRKGGKPLIGAWVRILITLREG
ncbi:MAG: hypothetical protein K2X76_16555 [Sphingomonas sp.]|nr:hypothetical protein [Sphingomonas sp.]